MIILSQQYVVGMQEKEGQLCGVTSSSCSASSSHRTAVVVQLPWSPVAGDGGV
jgi:hypothetical protein